MYWVYNTGIVSSAEVMNEWNCKCPPHINPHGTDRDSYTSLKYGTANINNTLCCELLGWCFGTLVYLLFVFSTSGAVHR
jgi:hypothetical protein